MRLISSWTNNYVFSEWIPVTKKIWVDWDIESRPVQFQTDQQEGSGSQIYLQFMREDSAHTTFVIGLQSPTTTYIGYCKDSSTLGYTNSSADGYDVWTLEKSNTSLTISCNGMELVDYVFSDADTPESCVNYWSGDVFTQFKVVKADTAVLAYREQPASSPPYQGTDRIPVPDWLITSHVTQITSYDWLFLNSAIIV
eukprot:sb/3470840/